MKKFISPVALVSAFALVVSACSNETPTSPNLNTRGPSLVIGAAVVGQAQVCLASDADPSLTYSAGFTYSGDASNDTQAGASQPLLPSGCVTALLDQQPGISPSPIAWVNSTLSVNQLGGTWTYSCVVTPDEITISDNFCPNPYSGSGNVARTGENAFHGSTITFHYTPPVIVVVNGCSYSQGYYKNHLSYVVTTLANGGTFIAGGKLNVSGGLDRNLATTTDNTLTAAQIVNNLKPANAPASMRQLITAELNVARGATTTAAIDDAITSLRLYFAGTSATNGQIGAWTTTLDNFNNGLIVGAAPHCGDEVL